MGLRTDMIPFFQYCKENGVDFESTIQIGRQNCYFSSEKLRIKHNDFAEPLFRFLGAKKVLSLDYCNFEQADIIHDMNLPINENLKEQFSVVLDGGTLEHVFNYPVAIKNCMDMVKIGGHILLMTPANNYFGHGFYQFSPDLFFSLLSEQNGFAETRIFEQDDSLLRWFEIQNPKYTKCLIDICIAKNKPSIMCVVSKKIKPTPKEFVVLQSYYLDLWKSDENSLPSYDDAGKIRKMLKKAGRFMISLVPYRIRKFFRERRIYRAKKKLFYKEIKFPKNPSIF